MPLLPGIVGINARRLFPFDDDPCGHPQEDPSDEASIGEDISQVPHIFDVFPKSDFVDLFDLLPHDGKHPYYDHALDRCGKRATLFFVPFLHQLQEVGNFERFSNEL